MSVSSFPYGTVAAAGGGGGGSPTVSARLNGALNSRFNLDCYAGFRLEDDGDEYEYSAAGSLTQLTTWLDSGSAGDVWVAWTRTGGSLSDWNDLGGGNNNVRLNLASPRSFRIIRNTPGINTITGRCNFYDAASGGNTLQTTSIVTWSAEEEFDPCPICCFTPDTLITMADGSQKEIVDVREGDMIKTSMGIEPVGKVLTRKRRPMRKLTFADGRTLILSEDHPVHTMDKGFAAINPIHEYKDAGIVPRLQAGDFVQCGELFIKLIRIEEFPYPGTVYTFSNTKFFANDVLVY